MSQKRTTAFDPKTPAELELMREAGRRLRIVHDEVKTVIKPGARLWDLEQKARTVFEKLGDKPAFQGHEGFPCVLCTMLNSEIVHGIPDQRVLRSGDILSVDAGIFHQGYCADAAFTVVVGGDQANERRARFSNTVYKALQKGCAVAKVGNTLGDIGFAIQSTVEGAGYSIVKQFTGHGLGREMWMDPYVLNYGKRGQGQKLIEGMTICIEPIVAMGSPRSKTLNDGWTEVTVDGKDACQWEHCGVVTKTGFEIFC